MEVPMYAIVNQNGLFLMQSGMDYAFTADVEQASTFICEQNAQLKIRKLPMFKGLSTKLIKIKSK